MASTTSIAHASGTLTGTAQPTDGETVSVGSKTYTFQTTLTDADGNVQIGSDLEESLSNLKAAINLQAGAGTKYAASTTRHPSVVCYSADGTTLVVKAPGEGANEISTGGTYPGGANASWGASTLEDGEGNISAFVEGVVSVTNVNSEVLLELAKLTVKDD